MILSREQETLDFSEGKTWTSNCCFRAWNLLPPQADYCYSLLAHKLANDGICCTSWCLFKSVSLHLQKNTFADIDPHINKLKRRRDKTKLQNQFAKNLTTSNPQNKLVYRTTRYVYISDLMCITGGMMRKIHAIQEETCKKQFAKKERKKERHSGRE
jgi:hypothetical protein